MLVAIILVAVVILGGIAVVAMGFGGELALGPRNEPGYPDFETAEDVAAYRPPAALLGYDARATEFAFRLAGQAVSDRDAEIAALSARLRALGAEGRRPDDNTTGLPAILGQGEPVPVSRHVPAGPWPTLPPPLSPEAASRWESRLAGDRTTMHREDE